MPETHAMTKFIQDARDTRTNNIGIIDTIHKKIHEGKHYVYSITETATNAVDFINAYFIGGGSTKPKRHIVFEVSADIAGAVYLYEDMLTSGGGGATVTSLNSDRGSTNASVHSIRVQPTTKSSSTGKRLWAAAFGANAPPVRVGGSAAQRQEFIFNSSMDYQIRYDPSAGAATVFISAEWYEE